VTATLDGANAVTDHIARLALQMLLDAREGKALARVDTTTPLARGRALALMGRYQNAKTAVDLEESEGRLFLVPIRGGSRAELRAPSQGAGDEMIVDDALAFGQRVRALDDSRIVVD